MAGDSDGRGESDQSYYVTSPNEQINNDPNEQNNHEHNNSNDSLNLGQIIKETGDFGRFQVLTFAYTSIILVTLTWSMLTMAFTATIPDWSCIVTDQSGNFSSEAKSCSINGSTCDAFSFEQDMSTAVSQVRISKINIRMLFLLE